jgi:cytosol aminopeptidase
MGAARLLRHGGANIRSCDYPYLTSIIRAMSSKVFVLPIDPTSQSAAGALPPIDAVKLWNTTPTGTKPAKVGTTRIFYNTPIADPGHTNATAIVSLGEGFHGKTGDAKRELVRKAVGSGVKQVKELGDEAKQIIVDASADAHAAGRSKI